MVVLETASLAEGPRFPLDSRGRGLIAFRRPRGPPFHSLSRKGDVPMTFRTSYCRSGFGLSAVLCVSPAARRRGPGPCPAPARPPLHERGPRPRPPVSRRDGRPLRPRGGARRAGPLAREKRRRAGARTTGGARPRASGSGSGRWRRRPPSCGRRSPSRPSEASHVLGSRRRSAASLRAPVLHRSGRSWPRSSGACGDEDDLAERARRDGALPAGCVAAGRGRCYAAGRCWRSRSSSGHGATPSRWATGSRGCCPDLLAGLRGPTTVLVASRRVFALHGRPSNGRCAASGPSTWPSSPTASASRAARRSRPSTTPSSRPAWAATAWWWPSGAASWATSPASPRPRGCAGWTGSGIPTTLLSMVDSSIGGKVGDQPREGQEPDRGVPPAARGRGRPRVPRHAARARAPRRAPTRS